jgi:hypothetical protein
MVRSDCGGDCGGGVGGVLFLICFRLLALGFDSVLEDLWDRDVDGREEAYRIIGRPFPIRVSERTACHQRSVTS